MGGRLDFMSEHEYAISSLIDELPIIEQHLASGGRLSEQDVKDLRNCHARLARILEPYCVKTATGPAAEDVPRPHWLQPLKQAEEDAGERSPVRQTA